jgi:hypothetical protein
LSIVTQHLYDAIKKARETGEAWVNWNGERLRLKPIIWVDGSGHMCGDTVLEFTHFDALVKSKRSGGPNLKVEFINAYKDVGGRVKSHSTGRFYGWDDLCAVVVERHPLKEHIHD